MEKLLEAEALREVAYLAAVVGCTVVGLLLDQRRTKTSSIEATFWFSLATVLLLLVALKVLGVQFALVDGVRERAFAEGWYSGRRSLQADVIVAMLGGATVLLLVILAALGKWRSRLGPPIVAVDVLLTFLSLRAVSLHQVDSVLYRSHYAGVQVSALLELTLVLLIAAIAAFYAVREAGLISRVRPRAGSMPLSASRKNV